MTPEEKDSQIPSRIDGYEAADSIITDMMLEARKKAPATMRKVKVNSASYRAGYFEGLLMAHCQFALGQHPESNVRAINEVLGREETKTRPERG